jgi:dihydroorotase
MPNLKPPVTTTGQALAYREAIMDAVGNDRFNPLMTLYLTDNTAADEILKAKQSNHVYAIKYYPAGATTNSSDGVTGISKTWDALEAMQACGMPLLVHAEVTDPAVDIFDREAVFIDTVLQSLVKRFTNLKVVLEHVTTREGVDFVQSASNNISATITAHHLLFNRNAMFAGGINPHAYCLPVIKHEQHREALIKAATSGNPKFFLGTDSAPHPKENKESACGCAGIYTAHAALELYATAFENAGALDKLEGFASHYGADFYGLPRNEDTVTLTKTDWHVPKSYPLGNSTVVPMLAGETLGWRLQD